MNIINSSMHYYGDTVRVFFVFGALVMIASLPFVAQHIAIPFLVSIVGILIVGVAAGITSPVLRWSSVINVFISFYAALEFEWYAVHWYMMHGAYNLFFFVNQLLAVNFLLALYFSVKTFRGVRMEVRDAKITDMHV